MAQQKHTHPAQAATTKKSTGRTAAKEHERQKEELKTKLRNLPQMAKQEIIDDVVNNQVVKKQFGSFTDFLREQSVIGIGIGLVFGTQTKTVVDSIMKSLVDPITKLFLPGQEALTEKAFRISVNGRHADIVWGAIAYSLFSFIMVAIVVYVIYRLLRLDRLAKKKEV